ncbi:MAG: hypothetical protein WC980_07945 [Candidatus Brocadiia bacterium]
MSNIYQIGLMTYRESVRQPLLYIIIAVSVILILIAPLFSLFAFGEELSMVREVGLAAIIFGLILIAILTAHQVVNQEIERLTVMTLFSKPVRRSEFILGKFAGITVTLLLAAAIMGLVYLTVYWFKEGRPQIDLMVQQGKSSGAALWQFLRYDGLLLAKGVYLCFLQVVLLASFAVLIATYFPLVITGIGCFVVFALGHISDYLYQTLKESGAVVGSLGWLAALILPNFTILNVSSLIATMTPVSSIYIMWATAYTAIYCAIVLLVTIAIFGKREIK